jgi:hypothetical protein
MLSAENSHYGRAKSIMMLDHLQDWNASLYDIDESDSSDDVDGNDSTEELSTKEDALAIRTALLDSTTNGTYLSIEGNEKENTTGRGRRAPRRRSTAFDAWKSIYGLNGQHVPSRRHSVFCIDSTRDVAADLSSREQW